MIVDLNNLTQDQALIFSRDKVSVMKDYQILCDRLQKRNNSLSWLLNNVTSRNTNFSKVFYYMRCQYLLSELSNKSKIDRVITDDNILAELLSSKYEVECIGSKAMANVSFRGFLFCLKWSVLGLLCKSKQRVQKLLDSENATIIDCDIAKKTDRYNDRYYGNVLDELPKDKTKDFFYNIIYVPYPTRKDIALIDRNTPYKTIYHWDFLMVSDYISCFYRLLCKRNSCLLDYDYQGINQRPVLEFAYKNVNLFYFYHGFLYERVIYRMKKIGVNIRLYVDWWENQSIDKSFHWAMSRYYPNVPIHSYIGFMPDISENPITIATNTEFDLNIAPKHLFVCNKALLHEYECSRYKGKVELAPFYRAEEIWHIESKKVRNECFTILVPMGLNPYEVELKTKFFADFFRKDANSNVKVLLKPHPVYNDKSIRQIIGGVAGIEIVSGNIYNFLPKADLVVAANSTTTYEALALGKPLMNIIDPLCKISLQCPLNVSAIMWHDIVTSDDIHTLIDIIHNIPDNTLMDEGCKLRDYFFTKRTLMLSKKLFNLY